jgi:SAM-dependent methyltransferase
MHDEQSHAPPRERDADHAADEGEDEDLRDELAPDPAPARAERHAKRHLPHPGGSLARWSWVDLIEGAAEALPFADGTFSLVTCVYLFHELPRAVRRKVAEEMARALRPGGLLVFVDSFQRGDEPAFDGLLELFPLAYHEPYFADFVRDDLSRLFADAGLATVGAERAYMSKVLTLAKPEILSRSS